MNQPCPALRSAREFLVANMAGNLRVPGASRDDRLSACGVHLAGEKSYLALTYGCDYTVSDRAGVYQCLSYYEPIRYSAENGLESVRLGFEAFAPKVIRGAEVEARETWIWMNEPAALGAVRDVLTLLNERATPYLQSWRAKTA